MSETSPHPSLPHVSLAEQQAQWLAGARARLLRLAAIQRRRRIVDLGAGWGTVSGELLRRSAGSVLAIDPHSPLARRTGQSSTEDSTTGPQVNWMAARAEQLPMADASCDLIFTQCTFLWIADRKAAIREIARVLPDGGVLASIEPDYGGLMESPAQVESMSIWIDALHRAGATPRIGRALTYELITQGFDVQVLFLDRWEPARQARYEFLLELPLTPEESARIAQLRARPTSHSVVHLPFWLILATKRSSTRH